MNNTEEPEIDLQVTVVFEQNWDAMHKVCDTCHGSGHVNQVSCSWCGDGEDVNPQGYGSGKYWRYLVNKGSSRSSKTYSLIDAYYLYANSYGNKRCTVWRSTKTDCKKTVLNDMLKHFKQTRRYDGNRFNISNSIFSYENDSTIEIHGTDDEETVHGMQADLVWLNEPYQISRETFDQLDQRCSDFVFIDYNPKKGHWVEDVCKDPRALLIVSTFRDNPFCPPEARRKILSYQPVEASEAVTTKVLKDGRYVPLWLTEGEARAYDLVSNPKKMPAKLLKELSRCRENEAKRSANAFNWAVYGLGTKAEKPNRIFKWEEISVEKYHEINATKYVYTDWGKVDPWAIGEAKYYDGCLYLHELNYASEDEMRTNFTAQELAEVNREDEGIVIWKFNRLKLDKAKVTVIADSNRPLKIAMLRRHGWIVTGANKVNGSILDGISILENLRVFYTSSSPNIKYEQENYARKVDSDGKVQEEPEDLDNHHMDGARYTALHLQALGIIRRV